ncbi:MAG: tRNA lysidine(34) synthetase TilS [Pseudomonadota bacterium]|nr:tRNA lysidine(34) synthetase TilS [Pseudomonadota bacterium]
MTDAGSAPDVAPDKALLTRFRTDLSSLCDVATDRVLVAVSGGPDSLALLLLAHAALGDRCTAATVDHGLRAESADEASFVGAICVARGIDHTVLTAPLPDRAGRTANVSTRARALRYALLAHHAKAIDASAIATAHHADDQLETMIMRLNRGAGIAGVAGIRARRGAVIRPLLGWRRAELAAIVAACGLIAVTDPSNSDARFDRARLRAALVGVDWLGVDHWAASARALGEADAALNWAADYQALRRCTFGASEATFDPAGLPKVLVRRLAERCLRHIDAAIEIRGSALSTLLAVLANGQTATLGAVMVRENGGIWRFSAAPARRSH